ILLVGRIEFLARSESLSLGQRSLDRIDRGEPMYALLRSAFAAADDSGRGEEITDQVSLCFQIVRVQPVGDLEFAMSLVSQRNGGKGAESIGLFGLAAIGFP